MLLFCSFCCDFKAVLWFVHGVSFISEMTTHAQRGRFCINCFHTSYRHTVWISWLKWLLTARLTDYCTYSQSGATVMGLFDFFFFFYLWRTLTRRDSHSHWSGRAARHLWWPTCRPPGCPDFGAGGSCCAGTRPTWHGPVAPWWKWSRRPRAARRHKPDSDKSGRREMLACFDTHTHTHTIKTSGPVKLILSFGWLMLFG